MAASTKFAPRGSQTSFKWVAPAMFMVKSSGEITKRSLSNASTRASSLLIAVRTLVSIGVTWISEVFGQFNNATKRLPGSGCSRSSNSSHFHHAPAPRVQTAAAAVPAKRRRVHNSLLRYFRLSKPSACSKASHLRFGSRARHSTMSWTQNEGAPDVFNRGLTITEDLSGAAVGFWPVKTSWRTTPKAKRSLACEGGCPWDNSGAR